ncbi:acyl-CoA-like ligand-binding transcription factor [Streptomyces broussonetiae]|uniref:acyl-CoA-like ligand-binding transcription factor n=1 Tax=Streptomyces broussonetiae TaxID=2686304 RepID=UPI0035D8330B
MSHQELLARRERWTPVLEVPELWAASVDSISRTIRIMSERAARRTGREAADPAVRVFTGAVFGVMLAVAPDRARDPDVDHPAAGQEAPARLEEGLPLLGGTARALSTGPTRCRCSPVGCETWPTPPATAPGRVRSRTLRGCTGSVTSTAG